MVCPEYDSKLLNQIKREQNNEETKSRRIHGTE